MITQQIEPLQQQIEPICVEVHSRHHDLSQRIDDLAASMKLLLAQMSQLSTSFQSSQSTPPNARGRWSNIMSPIDSTQQSHTRPQNPYILHQFNDTQDATMVTHQTKTKTTRIPTKSTLYDWIKPKINGNHTSPTNILPDTNSNSRTNRYTKSTKSPPNHQHHQQQINPTHINDQWGDDLSHPPEYSMLHPRMSTPSPWKTIYFNGMA